MGECCRETRSSVFNIQHAYGLGKVHLVSYLNFHKKGPYLLKTFSRNDLPVVELDEYNEDSLSLVTHA